MGKRGQEMLNLVMMIFRERSASVRTTHAPASYSFLTDATDFLVSDRAVDALIEHPLLLNLTEQQNHHP